MLASAFAAAKVFVLPSYSEVMPLSLYEAAQAGCRIIVSRNVPVSPELRAYVHTAHPDKPGQFEQLISRAMAAPYTVEDKARKEIALSMPTWQQVADKILTIYQDVLTKATSD